MELLETEVKESPGLCRCCLSEGCYKDLTAQYPWMCETEVYADMLRQCFDISLSQQPEGPDGAKNLICDFCITRLRDATHFKKQVQFSEGTFVNMMLVRREIQDKEMACGRDQLVTHQDINEDSEDPKVAALEEPEVADGNVVSYEMDPLIKHEAVKEEDPEDLQEAAREDLTLSDEDDGVPRSDVSRHASPPAPAPALGAEYGLSRVFCCRVEVRDARDELLCSQCGEWSLTAARLQRHLQTHATRSRLQSKEIHHHHRQGRTHTQKSTKRFACDICDKTFTRKNGLKNHILVHSGVNKFSCKICNKKFTNQSHLNRHALIHSAVKPFSCKTCSKSYYQSSHLKRHLQTHSNLANSKSFPCDMCDKTFAHKEKLNKHILVHSGIKAFSCNICDKAFTRKDQLKTHMLLHKTDKPFSCNICDKKYPNPVILQKHMRYHSYYSRGKINPFSCEICRKSFNCSSSFNRHLLTHSNSKLFDCDICDKTFTRKDHLKSHILVHSGVKSFPCNTCSKSFIDSSYLKRHLLTHSGLKPFVCDICDKTFTRREYLKNHIYFHSGVKPFRCKICNKSFSTMINLKKHSRTHSRP